MQIDSTKIKLYEYDIVAFAEDLYWKIIEPFNIPYFLRSWGFSYIYKGIDDEGGFHELIKRNDVPNLIEFNLNK